ncbi:hypothetical protein BT96DRAFT_1024329 [Gymnopus androsaceus JB14]|uniref:G-protein coupled receptors family 1 profile domain-containing protein n=1 Tax=Gymnopus androsaceus JB14 TaxID=1447944 RepID=A0A6A4GYG2_9AGAR|nr:hypothetical protein BT96DRAFT_1024329 [Gymnopus androsaceus JB14]
MSSIIQIGLVNTTLLTSLVATWINLILYTVEVFFCVYFLLASVPKGTKFYIVATLSVDSLCTVAVCVSTYYRVVEPIALLENELARQRWSTVTYVITTYLAAILEQSYLLKRYWSITRNRITASILGLFIFFNFAFALTALDVIQIRTFNANVSVKLQEYTPLVSAAMMATTDTSLAIAIIQKLRTVATTRGTMQKLLRSFCFYAIIYGCVTAMSTFLLLVMWLININGYHFIYRILGRIYSLIYLVNLFLVQEQRADVADETGIIQTHHIPVCAHSHPSLAMVITDSISQERTITVESEKHSLAAPLFSMDSISR